MENEREPREREREGRGEERQNDVPGRKNSIYENMAFRRGCT